MRERDEIEVPDGGDRIAILPETNLRAVVERALDS